jgi:hypothetical protein
VSSPSDNQKSPAGPDFADNMLLEAGSADDAIRELASAFLDDMRGTPRTGRGLKSGTGISEFDESSLPTIEARYRVLVEQIPAVVSWRSWMAA